MKKRITLMKIISIIFIFQLIFLPIKSQAESSSLDDVFTKADESLQSAESMIDENQLKDASNTLYNTLLAVGTVLTVIIGGIIGIQFLLASAEDKAKIKEALIPYVIGAVVIFGAFGIWKLVVELGNSL